MKHLLFIYAMIMLATFFLTCCGMERDSEYVEQDKKSAEKSSSLISIEEAKPEKKIQTVLAFSNLDENPMKDKSCFVSVRLPYYWTVKEGENKDKRSSIKSLYYFYDEKERVIGKAGYQIFVSDSSKERETVQMIYKNLILNTTGYIDFMGSYQVVNNTYEGSTAVANIVYYHLDKAENKMINYGILAYNRKLSVAVLFEFDAALITKEEVEELAKSLIFQQ